MLNLVTLTPFLYFLTSGNGLVAPLFFSLFISLAIVHISNDFNL
jgi:hypothetical protein